MTSLHGDTRDPIGIPFSPHGHHRLLPAEVVRRSELLKRIAERELANRQRAEFHQLIVCTSGRGVHEVDFEPVELSTGTLLRIHPGQVQRFVLDSDFEAVMVIWPPGSHHEDPEARPWYPGSAATVRWEVDDALLAKTLDWVGELEAEQHRFTSSPRSVDLLQAMLRSLLLRLAIELPDAPPSTSRLPAPYLEYRELIEERLYERPDITRLARDLGYSSRTLDRACKEVSGQTAKQVLDERVAFEIRRLLSHTDRPIARVATDFGFRDPSNFSKFVKRHLGLLPRQIRDDTTAVSVRA